MMIIITTTTMALSFNRGYHWRNGCPELNYVYPLWVNICLEKAVKPIDTFYSFCRFVEAIYPFLLQKKNRIQNSVSVRWSIQIEKIGSAYYIYIHISYISYTHHIHITLVVPSRQCLFTYWNHQQCCWFLYVETCNFGETNPQYRVPEIACQVTHVLMT